MEADETHVATLELAPLCLEVYYDEPMPEAVAALDPMTRLLPRLSALWSPLLALLQARGTLSDLGLSPTEQTWEVDLNFVDNATIQELNAEYRQKNQATDVLTFTLFVDSPVRDQMASLPDVQLGAIYVSLEWALDAVHPQGETGNNSPVDGFDPYVIERVVHGLLHLMGINHDTLEEYNTVVALQRQVLHEVFDSAL